MPSAGLFSHCRWTSGGFNVGKRWWGWHLLSWGHPCRSTCGSPDGHPGELTAPLHLLPQGFLTWHPGWVKVFAGALELQDHCCSVSRGRLAALPLLAPCPQPVALKLQPHVLSNVRCPHGELWSQGKCHCSCLFLARREKMISHACQSGSFLQHWISASLFKFLLKNPNLRQHSTWHLTLWLPWR